MTNGKNGEGNLGIAIVGVGCALPGAQSVSSFWTNILRRHDAIVEVPAERFDASLYYDSDRKSRDKIYSRWGGFLDPLPFDPMRFGIPPAALPSIDPIQLLAILIAEQALADAGYSTRDFPRERTSVILGMSGGLGDLGLDYAVRSGLPQLLGDVPGEVWERLPEWTEDSFAGILLNVTAGRIANRFDFGGVNFTVDAACASSLTSVYLASRELASGSSDMVIVGGVDTTQSPFGYLCFAKAQALSPTGHCKPFDSKADGIAISEGVVMMVLKRLEDAERDGDRIYAVIRGVAGSSDGRGRSMTAPRPEGQMRVLRRAYAQAGFDPSTVGLFEAHGTGTVAGDAAELTSLAAVLQETGAAPQSATVGSVKSMIGHTKSAAGVAGLLKAALSLYHKVQPPTLHVDDPNPKLREPDCPFRVNTEAQPWIARASGEPRRAGVSSFGFGGTNFHVALEEYQGESKKVDHPAAWPAELFLFQAPSREALRDQVAAAAAQTPALTLRKLAARYCRKASENTPGWRLAFVAGSVEDLQTKLSAALASLDSGKEATEIHIGTGPLDGKVAFLFSGQGSQYPGMFRELALYFPEFGTAMAAADAKLKPSYPKPLSSYVYPPPAFDAEAKGAQAQAVTDTIVAQPALGAVEMGALALLGRLGVRPDMTAGHSYGEYPALCAAGVFSQEALYMLSEARGRSIKESSQGDLGTMCAVSADAATVAAALRHSEVWIANQNAPKQTVLAGTTTGIEEAMAQMSAAGLTARAIPVACAFHSPLMEPAKEKLAGALGSVGYSAPSIPVFSNTSGAPYPSDPAVIAGVLRDHLTSPVQFVPQIRAMYDAGARVFVEVGPKSVLTGLARQTLKGENARFLAIDSADAQGTAHFLLVLGQLITAGIPVRVEQLYSAAEWELALADESPAPAPRWFVNGTACFAAGNEPKAEAPVVLKRETALPSLDAIAFHPAEVPNQVYSPVPTQTMVPYPQPAPIMYTGDIDAVMLKYQELMASFLHTQAAVMTAYLQGSPGGMPAGLPMPALTAIPAPVPVSASMPVATTVVAPPAPVAAAPVPVAAAPVPAAPVVPAPVAATPAPVAKPWVEILRDITADRTGYPSDMLDLDASMEADLGIDSIKRTEILTSLQASLSAAQQASVQGVLDALTRARTLRESGAILTSALGESASSAAAATPAVAPAETAPAVTAAVTRDWLRLLQEVVADRTGYPVDMLDPDAGVESDLGIDSIKRVEILTNLQQGLSASEQGILQGLTDSLSRARSLREIAAQVEEALGGSKAVPSPPAPGASTPVAEEAGVAPRFRFALFERPDNGQARRYPGRVSLITDDESGIAAGIAEDWNAAGERAVLLRHHIGSAVTTNGVFSGDLRDPDTIERIVTEVRRQYGPIGAVVHALALRPGQAPLPEQIDAWQKRLQEEVRSLYLLARATGSDLKSQGREKGALFAVLTGRGGNFALTPPHAVHPAHESAAAFVRTYAQEYPEVSARIVDLSPAEGASLLARKVVAELGSADPLLEIGLAGDRRLTPMPQVDLKLEGEGAFESSDVVLITGGARGVTAAIAKKIAHSGPRVILAGSSPLPSEEAPETRGIADPAKLKSIFREILSKSGTVRPADIEARYTKLLREREIRENLATMQAGQTSVEYAAVDVRDPAAFGDFLASIYRDYGRLDYVLHGAGIIEDKLIADKKPESFDRVLGTKANSAFILARALDMDRLKRLVFMSSIAASFGNRGQADYSAANGCMDGIATLFWAHHPGKVVSIAWGPWGGAGMASEEIRKGLLSKGIRPVPMELGAEAGVSILTSGATQPVVVIGDGPWAMHALPSVRMAQTGSQG